MLMFLFLSWASLNMSIFCLGDKIVFKDSSIAERTQLAMAENKYTLRWEFFQQFAKNNEPNKAATLWAEKVIIDKRLKSFPELEQSN